MEVIDNCESNAWDAYARQHPEAFLFHTSVWRTIIERSFGHRTIYLAAMEGGNVRGILPLVQLKSLLFGNFVSSLPFVTSGGVCADNEAVAQTLLRRAVATAESLGAGHLELRQESNVLPELETREHKVSMRLPLAADADDMFASFRSEIRNRVHKAEKAGLVADICGAEGLDDFYYCFTTNMRDLGTPAYGREFFANMFDEFSDQDIRIVRVRQGKTVMGAGIMVFWRDRVELPWVSSLRRYFELSPNNLLYWHAMVHAIERGMKTFDFGRSTLEAGTYEFKKRWGAEPHQLFWQYWAPAGDAPDLSPGNPKFKLAIRIWQKLPVPLTKLIGPPIVKYLP